MDFMVKFEEGDRKAVLSMAAKAVAQDCTIQMLRLAVSRNISKERSLLLKAIEEAKKRAKLLAEALTDRELHHKEALRLFQGEQDETYRLREALSEAQAKISKLTKKPKRRVKR